MLFIKKLKYFYWVLTIPFVNDKMFREVKIMSPYEYFELESLGQKREKFLKRAKDLRQKFEERLARTTRSYKDIDNFEAKLFKLSDNELLKIVKNLDQLKKYEKQSKKKQEMNMYQETEVFYNQEKALLRLIEATSSPSRDSNFVEYNKKVIEIVNLVINAMEKSKQRADEILSHESFSEQQRYFWGNNRTQSDDLEHIE